jgi:hypothetical protein
VQIVERFVMLKLLAQRFFSLGELNRAIALLIAELNTRPFQKLEGTRDSWFAQEKALLKALPTKRYEHAQWKRAKVHVDYHVEVEHCRYSVPHTFVGKHVDVRLSASGVEIFLRGKQLAVHLRATRKGSFTTVPEHRPPGHQNVIDLSIEKLYRQAETIGASTAALIRAQSTRRLHPHESIRSALGIVRLAKDFTGEALELACSRALKLNTISYRSVRNLILHPPAAQAPEPLRTAHEHVRGADYFAGGATC